jgi:YVTN family beta-propeller protein
MEDTGTNRCLPLVGPRPKLPGMRRRAGDARTLATVMFTDIVGSTELASELGDVRWKQVLATHHGVVRGTLKRYNGREIDTAGDGFFATFPRPADAIRCATAIVDQLRDIGIHIRAGIHMGEVEQIGAKVGGIAVHIGARVASKAGDSQVLVSSTVRDLVAGSDIRFADDGMHDLKGVPGEFRLFSVEHELKPDAPDRPLVEAPQAKAARRRAVPAVAIGIIAAVFAVVAVVLVLLLVVRSSSNSSSNVVAVPGANTVSVIDTSSNRFAGTISAGDGPVDAVSGGGSIWVINTSDQTFSRIDPDTEVVTSGARSVGGSPTGIAYGAGSVWIITEFGGTNGASGSVLRFDPGGGGPRNVIPVGNGVASIAFGDGAVWVTNTLTNTLSRIDPGTNAVEDKLKVGDGPQALTVGAGYVWVANTLDNSIWKIDDTTDRVVGKFTMLAPPSRLALAGSNLWALSESDSKVAKIDASTGTTVAMVSVGAQPEALAVGADAVWVVAGAAHEVDRIDAAHPKVVARLEVDGSPEGIAIDGAHVWVTVHK